MNSIGKIIRHHRESHQITVPQLAQRLSVKPSLIRRWERGFSLPQGKQLTTLSEELSIPTTELTGAALDEFQKLRLIAATAFLALAVAITALVFAFLPSPAFNGYNEKSVLRGYGDTPNSHNRYAVSVTMTELLATPEKYHGKLVVVEGVGNLGFESDTLWMSKEAFQYQTDQNLWLRWSDRAMPYEDAKQFNGKYVLVEGIYDMNDKGHMSGSRGTIRDINRYKIHFTEMDDYIAQ